MNAQSEAIEIVEVKEKKKILFYAINHTEIAKEVFFKVDGKGFRRSSYRPVIKKVPAQKKILLATLIPLKNATPEYTYFHSFDDELQEVNVEVKNVRNWKALEKVIDKGETIIFTKEECGKCEKLIGMLKANRIPHKAFNISESERFKEFFWNTVSKMKRRDVMISSIPIAIVKGKLHESLNLISFIEMLKQ
ncbi:glutaredoxin domain-containing protein [Kordia sp. SMS9]|uniref:glutaredoxin domain-containing protein n=1 Tax=Kordia sp. SMS9 TaxID=2282170 RepID=UPI000E0D2072|nr:glutaredoxin domain-containing protein [Kordia sp. SMS9]